MNTRLQGDAQTARRDAPSSLRPAASAAGTGAPASAARRGTERDRPEALRILFAQRIVTRRAETRRSIAKPGLGAKPESRAGPYHRGGPDALESTETRDPMGS